MDVIKYWAKRPVTAIGMLTAVAGLAGLFPGPKEILVAIAAKLANVPLLSVPINLDVAVILAGVLLVVGDQVAESRKRQPRNFVAFRHLSLQAVPAPALVKGDVAGEREILSFEHLDCDQTAEMTQSPPNLDMACATLDRAKAKMQARLQANPQPAYAYYGISHIPFQIFLGCALSQTNPMLFDLDRYDRTWKQLQAGKTKKLGIVETKKLSSQPPIATVVRVAISYPIDTLDVDEVVKSPYDDILITVPAPALDIVTHYNHLVEITAQFREAIDHCMQRLPRGGCIHLFYSGPMSLGFSLGRTISGSAHPRVIAYNHNRQSSPRYAWGVVVNSPDTLAHVVRVGRGPQGGVECTT